MRPPGESISAGSDFNHYPKVSFLIPAWNEAGQLQQLINSILSLRYPVKELVLCAGGVDGTYHIATSYEQPGIIVLEQQMGEGKQRSLQRCFEQSSGEIIFLTDADCILDNSSFEETIRPLVEGREQACTGSRRPIVGQEHNSLVVFQWINHLYQETTSPDYIDTLYGINATVRRTALEKVGGFTAPAPIGTDLVLGRQLLAAGHRIRFVRHSRVQTKYQAESSAYRRQLSRWYRNRLVHGIHSRHWRDVVVTLLAGISSGFLLVTPFASILGLGWLWPLWILLLFNSILTQARMIKIATASCDELSLTPAQMMKVSLHSFNAWLGMAGGLLDSFKATRRLSW